MNLKLKDFANTFFDGINVETLKIGGKLSPKILIVSPNSKNYHGNIITEERKFGEFLEEGLVYQEVLTT